MSARFKCRLARTGTQFYSEGDQHRDASQVFAPESLAGLDNLRVQRGHVPARGVSVGRVVPGSVGRLDNGDVQGRSYIVAQLEITDAATAADIRSGKLREISLAYTCETVTDAAGRLQQTQIRYAGPEAHVALLDSRNERARCGEYCAVREDSMIQQVSDGGSIVADACECTKDEQAARDRVDAWLDECHDRYGVRRDAVLAAASAKHGDTAHATRAILLDAAASIATRQDSYAALQPAQFAPGRYGAGAVRQDAQQTTDHTDDSAFRAALARKDAAAYGRTDASGDHSLEAAVRRKAPGASPEVLANMVAVAQQLILAGKSFDFAVQQAVGVQQGTRSSALDSTDHDSDDAFRAALARKVAL